MDRERIVRGLILAAIAAFLIAGALFAAGALQPPSAAASREHGYPDAGPRAAQRVPLQATARGGAMASDRYAGGRFVATGATERWEPAAGASHG
jgi:hypothetical protein